MERAVLIRTKDSIFHKFPHDGAEGRGETKICGLVDYKEESKESEIFKSSKTKWVWMVTNAMT